jgi:glycosyltransferase involved in cell wall biosynthesis
MFGRIRILHIIDSLELGGTEKQCIELMKRIDKNRYDVELLTFEKGGPLHAEVINAGIALKEIKIPRALYHPESLLGILKIAAYIRKNKFRLVQTYGIYSNLPGIMAAKMARVPIIIGGKREMNEIWARSKVKAEMILLRHCDKVVANANRVRNYLARNEGIPERKIEVIYNGIDLRRYCDSEKMEYSSRPDRVGMIANFRPSKDPRTFLRAAAEVIERKPYVMFGLVGSGASAGDLKTFAKELGIWENVIFYGAKTGKALLDIFNSFTITVLSSKTEGFPNVLLESMALGIPVIANPSGGVPELIEEGVTGYLFPPERADILAKRIIYLIENKGIAMKMGEKAREHVRKNFSFDLMAKRFEELYENMMEKKRA